MSPRSDKGRPPGLRSIPPAPATYRLRSQEPARHGFHLYMPLRDLEHAAAVAGLSAATAKVLDAMAKRTEVDGTTRAGVREIARALCRSPGTIKFHMKRLVADGFIEASGCREDNRYRVWRIAGMDRRDVIAQGSGENHHRGGTTSRDGIARHPSTSRDRIARIRVELPGELIEKTRASTHDEPPAGGSWGRATRPGIEASREALAAARNRQAPQERRRAPQTAPDGASEPDADLGAHSAVEHSQQHLDLSDATYRGATDSAAGTSGNEPTAMPSCAAGPSTGATAMTDTDPEPAPYEEPHLPETHPDAEPVEPDETETGDVEPVGPQPVDPGGAPSYDQTLSDP